MLNNVISIFIGFILGWAFYKITVIDLENRTQDLAKLDHVKSKCSMWSFIGLTVLGTGIICVIISNLTTRYEVMILFCICLSISWVDWLISKIPNEFLLALLLCKLLFMLLDHQEEFLKQGLIGFAAASFLFLIPSIIGIPIGAGDIKFAAVIGFYFGLMPFVQIILIMAVALLAYLVYLLITKKGSWKTMAPMGPFFSFGVMLTALYSVF